MRLHIQVALAVLLVSAGTSSAFAYVPATTNESGTRLRWMRSNCVVLRANSAGSADVSDGSEFTAIQKSVEDWHKVIASCSYIRFQLEAPAASATIGFDREGPNENAIVFVESNWPHEDVAAGITTVFFVDNKDSAQDGRILDADVELNGQIFTFGTIASKSLTDVENTLTHELGHVLGLDHPCDDGTRSPVPKDHTGATIPRCNTPAVSAAIRESTMYNFANLGETKKRTPEDDDILGICETYPAANDPGSCAPVDFTDSGGCSLALGLTDDVSRFPRGVGLAAVLLLLGVLLLGRKRRNV
ncbi:MAG: hypothetical protein KC503_30595 [Myxococcales bacterium]|nr:hypothetical protein [Myxococcales bacterium]